jgi:hypothetical protein
MSLSIHLDREPGVAAEEVEHIRARRMLPPELETVWALAKGPP